MCLIIASPNGIIPEQKLLDNAIVDNPDGWGFMTARNGKIEVRQGFHKKSLQRAIKTIQDNPAPYVIHYRWATHGLKNIENCHPFKVAKDLYVAHNGIISIDQPNKLMSDTWHFAEWLKRNKVEAADVMDPVIMGEIEHQIGWSNKLAFLDANGNISLANEKQGTWHTKDIWLSNKHSCDTGYKQYYRGRSWAYSDNYDGWGEYERCMGNHAAPKKAVPLMLLPAPADDTLCEYCGQDIAVIQDREGFSLCQPCSDWCNKVDEDYMEREALTDEVLANAAGVSMTYPDDYVDNGDNPYQRQPSLLDEIDDDDDAHYYAIHG